MARLMGTEMVGRKAEMKVEKMGSWEVMKAVRRGNPKDSVKVVRRENPKDTLKVVRWENPKDTVKVVRWVEELVSYHLPSHAKSQAKKIAFHTNTSFQKSNLMSGMYARIKLKHNGIKCKFLC